MSEFVSVCPKCRQRIMCDTEYVGKRVACPVCLQEITMPQPPPAAPPAEARPGPAAPPASVAPAAAAPRAAAAEPSASPAPTARAKSPVLPMVIGAVVLAGAAVAGFLWFKNLPPSAKPVASAPAPTPAPATTNAEAATRDNIFGCRAIWTFAAGSGPEVRDASGNHNPLVLSDPAISWSSDAAVGSHSLSLQKHNYAQITKPVIDTTASFTISTWVKLTEVEDTTLEGSHNQTFVSIDGQTVSAFYLQLNYHQNAHFAFTRMAKDAISARPVRAVSKERPEAGVWYHLAGVYNASNETISLYVNGELQDTVRFATPWQASGYTAVGRAVFNGHNVDFTRGLIGETRIYASALTVDKIRALANKH